MSYDTHNCVQPTVNTISTAVPNNVGVQRMLQQFSTNTKSGICNWILPRRTLPQWSLPVRGAAPTESDAAARTTVRHCAAATETVSDPPPSPTEPSLVRVYQRHGSWPPRHPSRGGVRRPANQPQLYNPAVSTDRIASLLSPQPP